MLFLFSCETIARRDCAAWEAKIKQISHKNSTAAIFTVIVGNSGVLQKHQHLHINERGRVETYYDAKKFSGKVFF